MLKRGDKGPAVVKVQQALIELGFSLPRWGADGDFGMETIEAFARFMRSHGAEADDDANVISDDELKLLDSVVLAKRAAPPGPRGVATSQFFDRRKVSSRQHIFGRRTWKEVTGICLHQTACVLGERPARWDTVGCHVGVTRSGKVIWLHDFDFKVVHGNGWNAQTVGIEMDGLYEGVDGNPKTVWDDPSTAIHEVGQKITPELVSSSQAAIEWIIEEVARHGGKINAIVAHRQASSSRRNDPGSALWKSVALPMQQKYGIGDGGKGYKIGNGYPIPEEWNSAYTGIKY